MDITRKAAEKIILPAIGRHPNRFRLISAPAGVAHWLNGGLKPADLAETLGDAAVRRRVELEDIVAHVQKHIEALDAIARDYELTPKITAADVRAHYGYKPATHGYLQKVR